MGDIDNLHSRYPQLLMRQAMVEIEHMFAFTRRIMRARYKFLFRICQDVNDGFSLIISNPSEHTKHGSG